MPTSTRRRDGEMDIRVGARLRFLRLERGLTQEALGKLLGLTFQQVQKYEKGTNAIASTRIPQLCKILKITPNDLFSGYVFHSQEIVADSVAVDLSIRVAKLGVVARRAVVAMIELVEGHNDGDATDRRIKKA